MKTTLKQLAQVQIGYQTRGRIVPEAKGACQIIQIRDLDDQCNLRPDGFYRMSPKGANHERYQVNRGDVLFLSRGNRNLATAVNVNLERTIAAGYFFILRLASAAVLPEYLAWYINSEPAQQYIQNVARRGTYMPVVPKSALEALEVDVPPVRTQRTIVELDQLSKRDRKSVV